MSASDSTSASPDGEQGPPGEQGDQGDNGDPGIDRSGQPLGPSRAPHGAQQFVQVEIPSACQDVIAASLPALPSIPAAGADNGSLLQIAGGFVVLGAVVLIGRRRFAHD